MARRVERWAGGVLEATIQEGVLQWVARAWSRSPSIIRKEVCRTALAWAGESYVAGHITQPGRVFCQPVLLYTDVAGSWPVGVKQTNVSLGSSQSPRRSDPLPGLAQDWYTRGRP